MCYVHNQWYNISCATLYFNPLSAKLNLICHLLALLGAHHILHVSRIRVNVKSVPVYTTETHLEQKYTHLTTGV